VTAILHRWDLILQLPDGQHLAFNGTLPIQPGGTGTGARQHILAQLKAQNPGLADAQVVSFNIAPDQL
jgi:hypothetical protein